MKAKNTDPQINAEALNKKRLNKDTLFKFMSFAPTDPKKKRIIKEEIPNQRFINISDKYAPRTPVQFSTDPRLINKSPKGTFSILL